MILVTGAGGTVGREVMRALSAVKAPARGAYRSPERLAAAAAAGMDAVAIDFERPATFPAALAGVEALFLASGNVPRQSDLEIAVVRAAREAGVRRLVKLSVWDAPGEAFHFARLHRIVEREIETSGVGFTLLRPNGFMQNFVTFMGAGIRSGGVFAMPGASARVSWVDVRDVAAVAAAALTGPAHAGKAWDLSGPEALTPGEIASRLSAAAGRAIRHVEVSLDEQLEGMLAAGIPRWQADAVVDLSRYYQTGAAARLTSSVREVLGREPIPFDRFARDHASALQPG